VYLLTFKYRVVKRLHIILANGLILIRSLEDFEMVRTLAAGSRIGSIGYRRWDGGGSSFPAPISAMLRERFIPFAGTFIPKTDFID
jgi:hypothetical protein